LKRLGRIEAANLPSHFSQEVQEVVSNRRLAWPLLAREEHCQG
jgi:hypothetical protein